jgi:hypothetical protein
MTDQLIFGHSLQSGGDPHIRPIFGSQYILPNDTQYDAPEPGNRCVARRTHT